VASVDRARIRIDEAPWGRIEAGYTPHPHAFERQAGIRVASVQVWADGRSEVVAGIEGLVLLKTAGSEFRDFLQDEYTTLAPTGDRILATAVTARWRLGGTGVDWDRSFSAASTALREAFAITYSRSLQQTLFAMGQAVLAASPDVSEVRLSLPNKHHYMVDLSQFELDNPSAVFYPGDRPYGLIEGSVLRAGTPPGDPGHDW
jgi:urate oxidase